MSNIIICKKEFVKSQHISHHLKSTHKIDCEKYIQENFEDFSQFGWKKCIECNSVFKGSSNKCGKCYTKNHKIKEDKYILCKCCNKSIHCKVISEHLKLCHNILFKDYVKENLNDFKKFGWCNCIICGNITKKQGNKHETTCSRKCISEYRKTLIGEKSIRFGAILSAETKNKISIGNIGKEGLKGDLNPACRKEVREKMSKTRIKLKLSKGSNNPMYGKTHTPEAIRKIFSHRKMNKLEKLVADELDKNNIEYYFQFFITENEICKSYDFKLKDRPIIIETDGDFWHGNPNTSNHYDKVDVVRKNDIVKNELASKRGYKIIRLWESEIKKDPSIVIKSING